MADDTLARMFWSRIDKSGDAPAQQVKRGGKWETLSWRQVGETVREVALEMGVLPEAEIDALLDLRKLTGGG